MLTEDTRGPEQFGPAPSLPALKVAPIHGVLPYAGSRNPLTRSDSVKRVSMTIATPMTDWKPQVYHFDGESEYAVALDVLRSPDVFGLEVQLAPIQYFCRRKRKLRNHHFDLRVTFNDGYRRAIYVKNARSLARRSTIDEIEDIFAAATGVIADECIVVNADDYTRAYRDNLRRIWDMMQAVDAEADAVVEAAARNGSYCYLSDLIALCDIEDWRAYRAALRLIGRGILRTDLHGVCAYTSLVELAA
ncbi:hypothetical protein [Sagittula salina]|uniref:TnsA endonuclease N-terminal domain-containing protein n=1 Tax=Sagittula salina TaxID=2820268 RepID=A0A940MTF1_9RHOB|nr:hypothetical protein [Sagittula salina]MBP0483657.1 hypothetical protein [Sagittula salina]